MSYSNYNYDVYPGIINAGNYANLAYYNGGFPRGYMASPPRESMGQTVVPAFGTYGYSGSVTHGITIPGNYLSLRQAYGNNSANGCSMFASNGMP